MPSSPTFSWTDSFLLGYTPMDEVHREFVAIVSTLLTCADDKMLGRMQALAAHCESHFNQEHAWMDETGFPAADCHKDEHAQVLASVHEVTALVAAGNVGVARRLAEELVRWFPGHADYLDSALAQWMSKKKLGGVPVVLRRSVGGAVS